MLAPQPNRQVTFINGHAWTPRVSQTSFSREEGGQEYWAAEENPITRRDHCEKTAFPGGHKCLK